MKLYTRTGDDGTTGLFGGDRVGKDDPRVEAYGTVDELNAALGLAAAACASDRPGQIRLSEIIAELQSRLFDLGADLATPQTSKHRTKIVPIDAKDVSTVEAWIDEIEAGNEPMRSFILPGGTEPAARLHAARTVCRRAERRVISLARIESINEELVKYLNRVGDLLFAMARRANAEAGVDDIPWRPGPGTASAGK
jgi:cob(I)alamin adenosyltransferase